MISLKLLKTSLKKSKVAKIYFTFAVIKGEDEKSAKTSWTWGGAYSLYLNRQIFPCKTFWFTPFFGNQAILMAPSGKLTQSKFEQSLHLCLPASTLLPEVLCFTETSFLVWIYIYTYKNLLDIVLQIDNEDLCTHN